MPTAKPDRGALGLQFEPAGFAVLRAPLLPHQVLKALYVNSCTLCADGSPHENEDDRDECHRAAAISRMRELAQCADVSEALWVASPDLWRSISAPQTAKKKVDRADLSLARYVYRMCTRPTPFGLFATCCTIPLGNETHLSIAPREKVRRHVRLDMTVINRVYGLLTSEVRIGSSAPYRLNSSLYRLGESWRYVETDSIAPTVSFRLTEIRTSDAVDACIHFVQSKLRVTAPEIAQFLEQQFDVERTEAYEFVAELVKAQVLEPSIGPIVVGEDALNRCRTDIAPIEGSAPILRILDAVSNELQVLNNSAIGTHFDSYRQINLAVRSVDGLGDLLEKHVVHLDAYRPRDDSVLGSDVIESIRDSISVVSAATAMGSTTDALDDFCERFRNRFGSRFVPLPFALDTDTGVGFGEDPQAAAQIEVALKDMRTLQKPRTSAWGPLERILLGRLVPALRDGRGEIEVSSVDFEEKDNEQRHLRLPNALSAIVRVFGTGGNPGDPLIAFESASGPSGASLLGRFCHGDEDLLDRVQCHLRREEGFAPDVIFAELAHLPVPRAGNVLARPAMRSFVISLLGYASVDDDHTLVVRDLLVGVRQGRVVLWSPRHDREVVPRLTSAQNWGTASNLSVYRFLTALQSHGVQGGMSWSWGALESLPFLPRVRSGRAILAPARWIIDATDVERLHDLCRSPRLLREEASRLRSRLGMPLITMLREGDNFLPVNWEDSLSLEACFGLRKEGPIVMQETLELGTNGAAHGIEESYSLQLVVPFERVSSAAPRVSEDRISIANDIRRSAAREYEPPHPFLPGSEWLFFKIYCTESVVDRMLRKEVRLAIADLQTRGLVKQWFFVRYRDPEFHLRLRLFGDSQTLLVNGMRAFEDSISKAYARGEVRRLEIGTYEPEVERYGGPQALLVAERLFCADSVACVRLLEAIQDGLPIPRHHLIALGLHHVLEDFQISLGERLQLLGGLRDGLGRELFPDVFEPQHRLSAQYRREKRPFAELLDGRRVEAIGFADAYAARRQAYKEGFDELAHIARCEALEDTIESIACSLMHMHVNRLARVSPREQEFVVYEFLCRFYRSAISRNAR